MPVHCVARETSLHTSQKRNIENAEGLGFAMSLKALGNLICLIRRRTPVFLLENVGDVMQCSTVTNPIFRQIFS